MADKPKMFGQDLAYAVLERQEDRAKELLNKGADVTFMVKGDMPIHIAARFGMFSTLKALIRHDDDPNRRNEYGNTAMHFAAKEGREDIVKYLIKHGAEIDLQNNNGDTALHAAVGMQPMDVIERFVKLGMDVNKTNNKGETPLHHAVMFSRDESVEALLLSGADPLIKDYRGQRPDQIARNKEIGELIRTYTILKGAMESGYIRSEGMRMNHNEVTRPKLIPRVGLTIEKIVLPTDFPTTFYFRREFSENTTIKFTKDTEEEIVSDVFVLRVRDVHVDLHAELKLPIYTKPNDRQLMYVRFLEGRKDKKIINDIFDEDEQPFCHLDADLVPETTTAIVMVMEPKAEVVDVGDEAHVVNSDINPDFEMDIPEGAFGKSTTISLKVFDKVQSVEDGESNTEADETEDVRNTANETDIANDNSLTLSDNENKEPRRRRKKSRKSHKKSRKRKQPSLMSNVYEINISGEQPSKSIKMQIPLSEEYRNVDVSKLQVVRVDCGDEANSSAHSKVSLVNTEATIENGNIIFEADHFSMYSIANVIRTLEDFRNVEIDIQNAKERVQEARFFAMLKQNEEDPTRHLLLVECIKSSNCRKRRNRWMEKGFEKQRRKQSKALQLKPSQEFVISLEGEALFDSRNSESGTRKLVFSPHRASFQIYQICLLPLYKTGKADVLIYPVPENADSSQYLTPAVEPEQVAKLPVQLHLPPEEEAFGPEIEEAFSWLCGLELVPEVPRDYQLQRKESKESLLHVVPKNVPKRPQTAKEVRLFSKGEQYPSDILKK